MPIIVKLHDNERVLSIVICDPWAMDDLGPVREQMQDCLDRAANKIHRFIDMRQARTIPPAALLQVRGRSTINHPNNGIFVFVGGTYTVRTLIELTLRLFNFDRAKFFETEEEAWTYLHKLLSEEDLQRFSS